MNRPLVEGRLGPDEGFAPKGPAVADAVGEFDAGTGVEVAALGGPGTVVLQAAEFVSVSFSNGSAKTIKESPAALAAWT